MESAVEEKVGNSAQNERTIVALCSFTAVQTWWQTHTVMQAEK